MSSTDPDHRAAGLQTKDLVSVYLAQNAAQNQLWASFHVALFAAGAFALAQSNPVLLAMGGATFLIFVAGHSYLILGSLRLKRAAAEELRLRLGSDPSPDAKTLGLIARPSVEVRLFIALHAAVDLCGIALFRYKLMRTAH
jgi:hypothetical protein